jgi:hypothetical protein
LPFFDAADMEFCEARNGMMEAILQPLCIFSAST